MKLLVLFLIYSFVSCKLLNRNVVFQSLPNGRIQLPPFSVVHVPLPMFRGGSTPENDVNNKRLRVPMTSVIITTSIGSEFLDKRKKISIPSNCTVVELKNIVASKFPGSPPTELQKLYFSSKLLADDEVVGDISSLSPVPILLDMISGTSAYNKTLTIRQAIDAYVSSVVQQTYLSEKLKLESLQADDDVALNDDSIAEQSDNSVESGATNEEESEDENDNIENELEMETPLYRTMYERVNASIYSRYGDYIEAALENERDPEVTSEDTSAWRGAQQASRSQLTEKLAKEFDLNLRGLKSFGYYSVVLMSFAAVGSASTGSAVTLLAMIPALWLSKLRQLRLLAKIGVHLALPLAVQWDFLLPLLPAPYQAIALQDSKENKDSSDDSSVFPDIGADFDFSRTIKTALKPFRRNKWFKLLTKGTSFGKKKSRNKQKKVRKGNKPDSVAGFSVYSDVAPHSEEEEETEMDPVEEYLEQSHIAKEDNLSTAFDDMVDKLSSGLSDMEEDARTIAESGMEIALDGDDEDNANEEQDDEESEEQEDTEEEQEEAEEGTEELQNTDESEESEERDDSMSTVEEEQRQHNTEDSEEKDGEEEEEEFADSDSAHDDEADDEIDSAEDGTEDEESAVERQEAAESTDESDIHFDNAVEDADTAEEDDTDEIDEEIVGDSIDETETEDADLDAEDNADDDVEGSSEQDGDSEGAASDHHDDDNEGEESANGEGGASADDWHETEDTDEDVENDEYDDSQEDDHLDDTIETENDDDNDDAYEPEEESEEQDPEDVGEPDDDDDDDPLLDDEVDELDEDDSQHHEELPEEEREQDDESEVIDDNSEENEEQVPFDDDEPVEDNDESEEDSEDVDDDVDNEGQYDDDDEE